jgi:hypothetical protein
MAKAETVAKPTFKVRLRINPADTATIFRGEGLPFIDDKTDSAVKWLADKGYKPEEVEILGEKPAIWSTVYPEPVAESTPIVEPVVEPASAVAQ